MPQRHLPTAKRRARPVLMKVVGQHRARRSSISPQPNDKHCETTTNDEKRFGCSAVVSPAFGLVSGTPGQNPAYRPTRHHLLAAQGLWAVGVSTVLKKSSARRIRRRADDRSGLLRAHRRSGRRGGPSPRLAGNCGTGAPGRVAGGRIPEWQCPLRETRSGNKQAKAKLCCVERDEVAVAFGPPP